MDVGTLALIGLLGVGYHELACRGLAPWPFGTTPPTCWVPFAVGGGTYSAQLQAMILADPYILAEAAQFRVYACSLGLNPASWFDLQTYFVDHSYLDPGSAPPPEWPSVAVFGTACLP